MRSNSSARRSYWPFGLVLVVSMLAIVALCRAAIGVAFADRIYPGVQIDGVDLGGRTVADATARITPRLSSYTSRPILVQAGKKQLQLTPNELGFSSQPDTAVQAAYAVGREGGLPIRLVGPLLAARLPLSDSADALVDETALSNAIDRISEQVDQPGHDARLAIGEQEVTIVPEADGQTLQREPAKAIIRQTLLSFASGPLVLPVTTMTPTVTASRLEPVQAQAQRILSETLVLTAQGQTWPVPGSQLRAALQVQRDPTRLDFPLESLTGVVATAAKQIDQPPRNARILVVDGKAMIDESQAGYQVDQVATLRALHDRFLAAGQDQALDVPAVVKAIEPDLTTADLQPIAKQAQSSIDKGLSVSADDVRFPLTPAQFGSILTFNRESNNQWTIGLAPKAVALLVEQFNSQFKRPKPTAHFKIGSDGQVSLLRPVVPGRTIDEPAAVAAIEKDWRSGQVTLPVNHLGVDTSPAFLARVDADMRGIISDNSSSYAGSIPARAHNIELAVQNLNGTLVAPGDIFSFNDAVGPTTLGAGFQWGFAIQGVNKNVQTVPSVAGGICQVATSVFQPVFWAGYPIEERHWHDYWIDHYTSHGYVGLDATVDEEAGVDFKFQNNTGHFILVDAWTADETIHVELIGTKPDWMVRVTPPVVTDVVKAPTDIARTDSPLWPNGTTIVTEAAADGFKAAIDRHVISPDGADRVLKIRESYAPAQTTILNGRG